MQAICERIASGDIRRIVVLTGAGVSTSAGIPDFRTPGSGLYSQLERFKLKRPEDIFRLSCLRTDPHAFFTLAKELYPDGNKFRPTAAHYFIKLLQERGCLLRNITQQIDGLELLAGLKRETHVVQAHGSFDGPAKCIDCGQGHAADEVKAEIMAGEIPRCDECFGLVKPSIVFFEEQLPDAFFSAQQKDLPEADLLIVMGSSLQVQPFNNLINLVGKDVPRILINRERAGELSVRCVQDESYQTMREQLSYMPPGSPMREHMQVACNALRAQIGGFVFSSDGSTRDIFLEGDCDDGVRALVAQIGPKWLSHLEALVDSGAELEASAASSSSK